MRHRKASSKLSMMSSHRKAMLRSMVRSLFIHEKITTVAARAKEARRIAEHLIAIASQDTVAARRRAYMVLADRDLVGRLFKEIAPLFKGRKGGYTRIIPVGFRRGDGASLVILELTEKSLIEKAAAKKKAKEAKTQEKASAAKAEAPKKAAPQKHGAEGEKKPAKAEIPAPEKKPETKAGKPEERAQDKETPQEKGADKKKFMDNLRGFFNKKTDK